MAVEPTARTSRPFIGREHELAELRAGLAETLAGRSRLYLVAGEPGVGKTRICQELASAARDAGVRPIWGPCHEGDGAPAYWPWTQIVRATVGSDDRLRRHPLVADLLASTDHVTAASIETATPEQARFRLFDAVARYLREASGDAPALLVLDDLHWADRPSLRLLRFLARELHDARLMVVGTYRHTEVGADHPLAELVGDATLGERLVLEGLAEADVARFLELAAGRVPPAPLVRAVYGQTAGNPFFVGEVARWLKLGKDVPATALAIPESVREVIGRRIDRLSPECRELLAVAATIGAEFDVVCLHRALELPIAAAMTRLEEATTAGIVEAAAEGRGRWAFCHSLIRRVLYDRLTPLRRIELHQRVGEVLERLYGPTRDDHLAELAHHFFEAALGGTTERAVVYATRAAAHALGRAAYEDAVAHYERALAALDVEDADVRRRCELLIALGDAAMQAGESTRAKRTLRDAAELARTLGDGELLARTGLAFGWWLEPGKTDRYLVDLLEEAAAALAGADGALHARVLAHLAAELWYTGTPERRADLSAEAVAMARRVGDQRALAFALSSRHLALWGPANVEERLAVAGEVVRLATAIDDVERVLQGRVWQVVDFLEIGDIQAVDVAIALCERLAEELRQPGYVWWTEIFRAMRALVDGRFAAAEELIHRAFATGQRAQNENATQVFATQMFVLRREQGRLAELEPAFKAMVEQYPDIPSWRCGLAMLYAQLGRLEEARQEFERVAVNDFGELPRDLFWLIGMWLLADVCCALGDGARARVLYDLLAPYAGRVMVTGRAVVCAGSAAHSLAILAALVGNHDDAERHFEHALAMNLRLGARPFAAYTRAEYARMLLSRGAAGDRERAIDLLRDAHAAARELGMALLLRRVESLADGIADLHELAVPAGPNAAAALPATSSAVFRRDARGWTVAFGGTTIGAKDTKGMRFLATLLRHPGQEIHALDLVVDDPEPAGGTTATASPHALGDAGEMLDRQSRAAYAQRLDELRAELARAKAAGAIDAAVRLEDEIDFLARELSRAIGLGGRERRAGAAAERARLNATRAIKAAEDAIATLHQPLADYLRATIRTGTFCVYDPTAAAEVTWSF